MMTRVAAQLWRRTWARCDDFTRLSAVLYLVLVVVLLAFLRVSDVFRPDRTAWILGVTASYLCMAVLVIVRGRTVATTVRLQGLQVLLAIVVVATSTQHLGVLMGCAVGPVVVIACAATMLSGRDLALFALLGGVDLTLIMMDKGYPPGSVTLTTVGLVFLSGTPGAILLGYRRRLEAAAEMADLLSRTDHLTGLLNRHGLAEAAREHIPAAEHDGRTVGVLLLDLDHFKSINDHYGHAAGDAVLTQVARALQDAVRPGDVVARVGGEEMCVVLHSQSPLDLAAVGERLRAAVANADCVPAVTVSVGGAYALPEPGQDPAQFVMNLLDAADRPLYEVKASGRNAVRVLSG